MDVFLAEVIKTVVVCGTVLIAVTVAALTRRRVNKPDRQALDEISLRLERIEQSVEGIAIEVERVSEGQRFTAKVLAEKEPAAARSPARQITPH